MTKEQANKALYIVAFFAFLTTISNICTLPYFWDYLVHCKECLFLSLIGIILTLLLILAPFIKANILLLGVPIIALIGNSYIHSITALYTYFTGSAVLMPVGIIPGFYTNISYFLMDTTGLSVLILRSISYFKEHYNGLKTIF